MTKVKCCNLFFVITVLPLFDNETHWVSKMKTFDKFHLRLPEAKTYEELQEIYSDWKTYTDTLGKNLELGERQSGNQLIIFPVTFLYFAVRNIILLAQIRHPITCIANPMETHDNTRQYGEYQQHPGRGSNPEPQLSAQTC